MLIGASNLAGRFDIFFQSNIAVFKIFTKGNMIPVCFHWKHTFPKSIIEGKSLLRKKAKYIIAAIFL